MDNERKCIECGSTEHLIELESGKYGCIDCLNKLGQEQDEIYNHITNYLVENFNITNPATQAKTLQSIAFIILMENGLLDPKIEADIKEKAKQMFGDEK